MQSIFCTDSPCNHYFNGMFIILSSKSLLIIFPKMALCLSVIPLDHGDSPAVDITNIFNWSNISLKSSLLNSPPLSERILFGGPNKTIQCRKIASTISSLFWFYYCCRAKTCGMIYHMQNFMTIYFFKIDWNKMFR